MNTEENVLLLVLIYEKEKYFLKHIFHIDGEN